MANVCAVFDRLRDFYQLRRVNHLSYSAKGVNVRLFNGSRFCPPDRISFGNDIYVGPEAYFMADGGITIRDNVILGPRVAIFTSNHVVEGVDWLPYGPVTELGEVVVGPNTWVGACCLILPGVRLGEGVVCAAGSVINRDVPPLGFVAGNPAEVKRYRDPEVYLRLKREGRLYVRAKREGAPQVSLIQRRGPATIIAHSPTALEQRERYRLDQYDFQ